MMYSGVLLLLAFFLLGILGIGNGLGDYVINGLGLAFLAVPAVSMCMEQDRDGLLKGANSVTFQVIPLAHGNLIFRESAAGLSSRFVRF